METVDLLGLALWSINGRDCLYKLCPVFGIVQSSASVWLDYAMEQLLCAVRKPENYDFELRWSTVGEMQQTSRLIERNREHGGLLRGVFAVEESGRMLCVAYESLDL